MIDVSKLKPFEIKLKDDEKPNFTNWNYCNDISDDGYSQVLCLTDATTLHMFMNDEGYIPVRFSIGHYIPTQKEFRENRAISSRGSSKFSNNDSNLYFVISENLQYLFLVIKVFNKNNHVIQFYSKPFMKYE